MKMYLNGREFSDIAMYLKGTVFSFNAKLKTLHMLTCQLKKNIYEVIQQNH